MLWPATILSYLGKFSDIVEIEVAKNCGRCGEVKAAEQDAEICIYVRSSGTNFFPLSPNICTGQCYNPPKRTS